MNDTTSHQRKASGSVQLEKHPRVEHRLLLGLVAIKLLILALFGTRYGFHRDELYYLMCGRHFELGYVDHPFLVPWLASLSQRLFGVSLVGLRLFATLASAGVLYLTGMMTAYLGGGRQAQLLAALAILLMPFHWLTQNLFQTVPLDQLNQAAACLVLVILLHSRDSRWWLAFGLISGIGIVTKYTFLALGAATVAGLLLTTARRELVRPWIYLGGLVALAIFLPNLVWQVEHGWPTLEFMANSSANNRFPPPAFLGLQAVFMGPFSLPLFGAGFVFYFAREHREFRILGIVAAVVLGSFLVAQSKPYYATAIVPLLFAGGAVLFEERALGGSGRAVASVSRWKARWPCLLLLGNLLLLPVFLPVLPIATYARLHDDFPHTEFGEMIGWPELVEAIGTAYRVLPDGVRSRTVIVASNYGNAAALDLFGAPYDLPPVYAFQNSYFYWSRPTSIESVLAVGFSRETLDTWFGRVEELGVITNRASIDNEEAGRSFFLATEPRLGAEELRQQLRSFH